MKLIIAFIALVVVGPVCAVDRIAASLTPAAVQAAMSLAQAGDRVVLPSGTLAWTSGITWTAPANVTLVGAGTSATGGGDQTVIIDNIASDNRLLQINVQATGLFRMTGITFQSGTGSLKDGGTIMFNGPGNIRIDHCRFTMTSRNNYKVIVLNHGIRGVMDRNILDLMATCTLYIQNGRIGEGEIQGNYEWSQPTAFGTADYFFLEDNIINGSTDWTAYETRIFDGYTAAKVVVRFNQVVSATLAETHATGHSPDDRGLRSQEIYGNSVTSSGTFQGTLENPRENFVGIDIASGTTLAWGNAMNQVYKHLYTLKVTRSRRGTYIQSPVPTGWGYAGPGPRATGTVNVSGTAVTWVSGDTFNASWAPGTIFYVNGMSAIAEVGQLYGRGPAGAIATVTSTTSLTLDHGGHDGANLTGATFYAGSPWDGNTDSVGYPVLDQPGRGQGDYITGAFPSKVNSTTGTALWPNQALEPIYLWANTGSVVTGSGGSTFTDQSGGRVVANRDYYHGDGGIQTSPTSPFNGTAGVGWGTLANRPPAPVTPGVGYFAIDQGDWNTSTSNPYGVQMNGADGILYIANSEGQWQQYYEPYTYPHPLRSATTAAGTAAINGTLTVTGPIALP